MNMCSGKSKTKTKNGNSDDKTDWKCYVPWNVEVIWQTKIGRLAEMNQKERINWWLSKSEATCSGFTNVEYKHRHLSWYKRRHWHNINQNDMVERKI